MPEFNSKVAELLVLDNETRKTSIQKLSDKDASDILNQIFTKILKRDISNDANDLNNEEKDQIASGLGIDQNDPFYNPILSNSSSTLTSQARLIRVLAHFKEKQLADLKQQVSEEKQYLEDLKQQAFKGAQTAANGYLTNLSSHCFFQLKRIFGDRRTTTEAINNCECIDGIIEQYLSIEGDSYLKTSLDDALDNYTLNWIAYNRDNIDDKFTKAFKAWNTVLDEWGRNKTSFQEYIPLYSKNNNVSFTPIEMLIAVRIQKKAAEGKIAKLADIEGCYKYHWEDVITDSTELNGKPEFKVYKKEPYEAKLKQAGISQFEKEILLEFCRKYNTEHTAIGCAGNKPHYFHPSKRY